MTTRIRTRGSRVPSSGLVAATGSNATLSGSFKNPKNGATYTAGTYSIANGYAMFSDDRASITDETGSPGAIHSCTNVSTLIPRMEFANVTFTQRNTVAPLGSAVTTVCGSLVPYYLDQTFGYPHVGVPDGSSVALARVPSMSSEMLSGLNSLYELKDCQAFLKLIPLHFLWAAARGKRKQSYKALTDWLEDIKSTASSPIGLLQSIAGADLMWKFGVKPLISDINSVHNSLESIDRKLQTLLNKKWPVAGMFTQKATAGQDHVNGLASSTMAMYSQRVSTQRTTTKTWVYGTVKYIDASKLPSLNVAKHRALAEELGLSLNATDIWEAVPYSFVWDWFLPVQQFLEQFGRAAPDPSWLLTSGSWSSVKTVTNGYTRWDVSPISSAECVVEGGSGLNQTVPWTRKEYTRTKLTTLPTGFPSIYIPRPQWPNFDQSVTGIELLLQRIKRTLK